MTKQVTPLDVHAELSGTPYSHLRPLAVGGMGEVHVVRHAALRETRVLKIVRDLGEETAPELAKRMITEGRLLRGLRHPNIVEIMDLGITAGGRPFLVTELLTGCTLKDEVSLRGPIPSREVLEILDQILLAMELAHRTGIVHRDLKPLNIFYTGDAGSAAGRAVKIIDFGIAKILTQQAKDRAGSAFVATQLGFAMGSPSYMSPEQVLGAAVDHRADLYAIGAVGYYLLTARPPFEGKTIEEIMANQVIMEPPLAHEREPSVPRGLSDLITRALAKRPELRFESAESMRAAVRKLKGSPAEEIAAPAHGAAPNGSAQGQGRTLKLASAVPSTALPFNAVPSKAGQNGQRPSSGADAETLFQRVQEGSPERDQDADETRPLPLRQAGPRVVRHAEGVALSPGPSADAPRVDRTRRRLLVTLGFLIVVVVALVGVVISGGAE